jgi:hypothetical protein
MKHVILKDEWETFTIRFSINSFIEPNDESSFMRIIGSIPELTKSGSIGSGPIKMKRARKKFRWMYDKFGAQIRPWECLLKMRIDRIASFKDIIYSYSKSDSNHSRKDEYIYEREPSRILEILAPESYRGELGL